MVLVRKNAPKKDASVSRAAQAGTQKKSVLGNASNAVRSIQNVVERRCAMDCAASGLEGSSACGASPDAAHTVRGSNVSPQGSRTDRRLTRAEMRRLQVRREYNRKYMRERRSNTRSGPEANRMPRVLPMRGSRGRFRSEDGQLQQEGGSQVCGFCGLRPAVCEVTRLEITEQNTCGFRTVRVPYCGCC